jgi:hypothetical protein
VARPRKQIPDYQLHRQSGQARFRIDSEDRGLGPFGSEEAKRKYQELVRDLIERRAREEVKRQAKLVSNLTTGELVHSHQTWAKTHFTKFGQPSTEYGNIASSVRLVLDRHNHELLSSFGPAKGDSLKWCHCVPHCATSGDRAEKPQVPDRLALRSRRPRSSALAAAKTLGHAWNPHTLTISEF